ncbi:MAG TPA: TIGR04282 family arsenosugar biosynthesis glycosyltransferase [Longimicrobiales bacterium]
MAVDRVLVFAKVPLAGSVKTRLTPPLPPDEAALLYEACLRDVVALCARERARVELWYHQDARAEGYFGREFAHLLLAQQGAGHLGDKMRDAFERSFADGGERVIIVGSDVPTLPEPVLNAALDQIRESELVIGPTRDGGYYLIGCTRAAWPRARSIFLDVAWSTDAVFRTTVASATRAQLQMRVLPGWYDVDTIDDLKQALLDADPESNLSRWGTRPEAVHFVNAG